MLLNKLYISIILVTTLFITSSCGILGGDDDSGREPIGGEPSLMGAVGHEFGAVLPTGVGNDEAVVTSYANDVSTIRYTATVENQMMLELLKSMPDVVVNGNQISAERDYRITTKGFQNVYGNEYFTIMNYDASVGDTYSMNRNGREMTRKVTKVSKEDEYQWAFFLIKTIHVEETGRGLPGVSKVEYVGNHRFGMVGLKIHFEDGSTEDITIIAQAEN